MTDHTLIGTIAETATYALLYEVALSPKPGLVDPISNGAHNDMDFQTFQISIETLTPFFQKYIEAGFTHKGNTKSLFEKLRNLGYQAEQAMLVATNDINTHKGANFSFAVILGAIGWHMQQRFIQRLPLNAKQTEQILDFTGELTHDLIKEDFHDLARKTQRTHGEELFLTHGISGIRGEAAQCYPSLTSILLPYLRSANYHAPDEVFLRALVLLMSEIEDGNLLHRGGIQEWQKVKQETKKIHQANLSVKHLLDELTIYDQRLTNRNLSPGGAADLLSLGIFFAQLEGLLSLPVGKKI
ncbi:triphosphoribosyl-dephospho-CoA synthase CitG [Enterococcus mundtii]|uniref:Probable 2-(5''-triphosphoribosyl)-3'-dephosphocoenzyme-A synthase n=2 Tax=Enterococcus mundtii TaxID=53346 RepID=A0A2S7RXZ2_ENTMU|nr:triphosphoribosyl-dephospho-CoA synthase CitG [Enterococcus mundtii]PQF24966.1 triphosphoribosyl-dephospho-CoA synthase CitG [Enterococcus mundtii]